MSSPRPPRTSSLHNRTASLANQQSLPDQTQQPPHQQAQPVKQIPPKYKTLYLILYNFLSATLWSAVLGRVLLIAYLHGTWKVFFGVGEYVRWVQTCAGLEVVHSLVGLVRAPLLTTLMQVASRFLLVWGICHLFPTVAIASSAYSSMLVAWSVTEMIRYSYFAVNLAYGSDNMPSWLTWLRYNAFFVLYPLGIGSECWLVYRSLGMAAREFGGVGFWGLVGVLGVYVPGSYILFTHMMAQRRKVMRGSNDAKGKKAQ